MKLLLTGFFACAAATAAFGQHRRDAQMLDPTPADGSGGTALGNSDDLTALAFVDGATYGGGSVWVTTSDGRGLIWSAPVRVDADAALAPKHVTERSVAVRGDNVYVAWEDTRLGSLEIYLNVSNDRGVTWTGEQLINKFYAAGTGSVRFWTMAVDPDPAGGLDHVYFLISETVPGTVMQNLYLTASHDGGVTWAAPAHVPAGPAAGAYDAYHLDLAVRNGTGVFVLWQDDRFGLTAYDVFFQRSLDGGMTWLPGDRWLSVVFPGWSNGEIAFAKEGATLLAIWVDEHVMAPIDELRYSFSLNNGLVWATDAQLGNYFVGVHDVDLGDCTINNGRMVVTWSDDRFGVAQSFVSTGTGGVFPFADVQVSTAAAGVGLPSIRGRDDNLVVWWKEGAAFRQVHASVSRDGGVGWAPPIPVTIAPGITDTDLQSATYNLRYDNFLCAWTADDGTGVYNVHAGGFRPQTLDPTATFQLGMMVDFGVELFPAGQAGWQFGVLASGGTGGYLLGFGDGRNTGLVSDGYLAFALAHIPGNMSGTLSAAGAGTTPSLLLGGVPVGTTLYFAAVAFDATAGIALGALTDLESRTVMP